MAIITSCGLTPRHNPRTPLFSAVLTAGALLLSASVNAAVLYVDAGATGADSGASWDDVYTDLNNALTSAAVDDEIWVAEGS